MWTTIAGSDGQVPIKELRDQVIGEMTPAQIAEAENLARDWKPTVIKPRSLDRMLEELRTPTAIGYSVRRGNLPEND
jgi:hypothetical protein